MLWDGKAPRTGRIPLVYKLQRQTPRCPLREKGSLSFPQFLRFFGGGLLYKVAS